MNRKHPLFQISSYPGFRYLLAIFTVIALVFTAIPTPHAEGKSTRTDMQFTVSQIPNSKGGGFEPHINAGPGVDGKQWFYVDSPTGLGSQKSGNLWISKDYGKTWEFKPKDPVANAGESGDSYTAIGKDGTIYFTDLYLSTASIETSFDGGNTWVQNPVASEYVLDDRQWLVIGPSTDPLSLNGQTLYFEFNQIPGGMVMLRSEWTATGMEWVPCNGGAPITTNGGYRDYFDVDQNDGTIYAANGEGGSIYVYVSSDGGNTFQRYAVDDAIQGQNIFISVAVDNAGNVYLGWSTQSDIWMAVSQDKGQTWTTHKVTQTKGTRVLPWITAGDAGRIGMTWYGTTTPGDSNKLKNATWDLESAFCLNALDPDPDFLIATVQKNVHVGTISTGGLGGGADRDLGDFFTCDIDDTGRFITAYGLDGDNGPNNRGSVVMFARQIDGPYLMENVGPEVNYTLKTDGLKVKADASDSMTHSGEIVQYIWDWGDNTTTNTTTPRASHTYALKGNYTVSLKVVDSSGYSLSAQRTINVKKNEESLIEKMGGAPVVGGIAFVVILAAVLLVMMKMGKKGEKEKKGTLEVMNKENKEGN